MHPSSISWSQAASAVAECTERLPIHVLPRDSKEQSSNSSREVLTLGSSYTCYTAHTGGGGGGGAHTDGVTAVCQNGGLLCKKRQMIGNSSNALHLQLREQLL